MLGNRQTTSWLFGTLIAIAVSVAATPALGQQEDQVAASAQPEGASEQQPSAPVGAAPGGGEQPSAPTASSDEAAAPPAGSAGVPVEAAPASEPDEQPAAPPGADAAGPAPETAAPEPAQEFAQEVDDDAQADAELVDIGDLHDLEMTNIEGDVSDMSLEDLLKVEAGVSSRRLERTEEAPSTVTVLTRQEILRLGLTTLEEVLNHVPGYQATVDTYQGATARIYVRGMRSAFNGNVLFLLDGVPINDLFFGTAAMQNRRITVANIKRVEVIRGPGSALYGANAFSGVVNIVTVDEGRGATASVGNLASRRAALWFNERVGELRFSGFGSVQGDEGYRYDSITDEFGRTRNIRDPNDGHDLTLRVEYKGLSLSLRDMERTENEFLGYGGISAVNRGTWRQSQAQLNYKAELLGDRLSLDVGAGYARETIDALGMLFPAGYEIIPRITRLQEDALGGQDAITNGISAHVLARYRLLDAAGDLNENVLTTGVNYGYTFISNVSQLLTHDPSNLWAPVGGAERFGGKDGWADPDATRNMVGMFVQDQQRVFDALSATLGLRCDYYSDIDVALSPRAALVYQTPLNSSIKALYGHAFRAPNLAELYQRNNPLIRGNTHLRPETTDTLEFGYIQNLPDLTEGFSAYLEGTLYHNIAKELIALGDPLGSGVRPYENASELQTTGFELVAKVSPTRALLLSASASHIFRAVRDGQDTDLEAPRTMLAFGGNLRLWRLNFNASGTYRSASEAFTLQQDYFLLNGGVEFSLMKELTLTATGQNLLNHQYVAVSDALPTGVPQRGATVQFGLRYEN